MVYVDSNTNQMSGLQLFWPRFLSVARNVGHKITCNYLKRNASCKKMMVKSSPNGKIYDQFDRHTPSQYILDVEHIKIYRKIWTMIQFLSIIIGYVLREKLEVNIRIIITISSIAFFYTIVPYTIYSEWPDIAKILQTCSFCGVLVPGLLKLRLLLIARKREMCQFLFIEEILMKNTTGPRAELINKELRGSYLKIKLLALLFFVALVIFELYPMYALIFEHTLVPIIKLSFPGIDETQIKGFIFTYTFMTCMGVLGLAGSLSSDLVLAFGIFNYGILVVLLMEDLKDYDIMFNNPKKYSKSELEAFLRMICLKYRDTDSYVKFFNALYSDLICYSICAMYVSLICSTYAVINNGWISGIGYCIFNFCELYVLCYLGTYIDMQNEKLRTALYFVPWYKYSNSVQKTFMMLMHASMFNATILRIGPFAPLNVESAKKITSSIYSYNAAISRTTGK